MPKKRTSKQRKADNKTAQAAARREAHVRTVYERKGDPRYTQQRVNPDGSRTLTFENPAIAAEMTEMMKDRQAAFREQFGRDMGPEDPLFWDPDSDTPRFMSPEKMNHMMSEIQDHALDVGMDPAWVHAWQTTGIMLTEENQHLFTAHEIEQWDEAIDAYQSEHGEGRTPEDEAMTSEDLWEQVISAALTSSDPGNVAATLYYGALKAAEDDNCVDSFATDNMVILMGWIVSARDDGADAGAAFTWINKNLDPDSAEQTRQAGSLIGYRFAPSVTFNELVNILGIDFGLVLLNLAVALTATAGSGDAHWLRQFDLNQ